MRSHLRPDAAPTASRGFRAPGSRLPLYDSSRAESGTPIQLGFDELGTPLSDVTFVVVDLETTGGSRSTDAITEIGAVKVRAGEIVGEFQTLVDPGRPIPPAIVVLTGITQQMVVAAPRIDSVLPSFLEFLGASPTTVLVAHNAPFDVGFLRAAAESLGYAWPRVSVLDTVRLARAALVRGETRNLKLATLARFVGADTTPDHRALHDARATVEVMHAMLERLGPLGVTHMEDLRTLSDPVPHHRRQKSAMAASLGTGPGVYQFLGPRGEILYIGRSTDVRRRVRSYFTAAEGRRRIGEMLDIAQSVREIRCRTALEAQVRELRLIATHVPPYNRRSRRPGSRPWLRLTDETFPRLSIVRTPPPLDVPALGPFTSHEAARSCAEALELALPVRRCHTPSRRLSAARPCPQGQLGRCGGPCAGNEDPGAYALVCEAATAALTGASDVVETVVRDVMARQARDQRYEEAARTRDRLSAYLFAHERAQRLTPLWREPELIAIRRRESGWELLISRYGRLAASESLPSGRPLLEQLPMVLSTAEETAVPLAHGGAASYEETEFLAEWLSHPEVSRIPWQAGHTGRMPA